MAREKKSRSNTAALVEGSEEPRERLSLEETWPADQTADLGATEMPADEAFDPYVVPPQAGALELGVSSSGPFVAPAAEQAQAQAPESTAKARKQTVASMSREAAFSTFRDKLFELCFKYGFTLECAAPNVDGLPIGAHIVASDISSAKGTAKRALAVGNHISGLELKS